MKILIKMVKQWLPTSLMIISLGLTTVMNDQTFENSTATTKVSNIVGSSVSKLQELLHGASNHEGVVDLNSLLRKNIRDPIPISDFNVSNNGVFTNIQGQFSNIHLHGLKQFTLEKTEINLSKMNLSAEMSIPILRIIGDYSLEGTLTFLPVSGYGEFWMNLSDIALHGYSLLNATSEGQLEMGDIHLFSEVGDIKLHFENLMGGGRWSSFSNSLLNQLSELILDELKHSLLKQLSQFLKMQFNYLLSEYIPTGFVDQGTSNIVDSILRKTGKLMRQSGADPLPLPDHTEEFQSGFFFHNSKGELRLTNGTLNGLSSLYRSGDVIAAFKDNCITFEADFGFRNLTGDYNWGARLFGLGHTGNLAITVRSIEGFIRFKQPLKSGSQLDLDAFNVTEIRQIWLDVNGLGAGDFIMEIILNLVTNGLKMNIADTVAGPVKESIQKELDALNILVP